MTIGKHTTHKDARHGHEKNTSFAYLLHVPVRLDVPADDDVDEAVLGEPLGDGRGEDAAVCGNVHRERRRELPRL